MIAMSEYNEILVPTDGAKGFENVIEHAGNLGEKFDATIHALNVVDTRVFVGGIEMDHLLEELHEFGREMTGEVQEKAEDRGIPVIEKVEEGVPHKQVLTYAEENEIDLIVMGTHGRTGLGRFLMGSVAEKVIRKSEVPVMTVDIG